MAAFVSTSPASICLPPKEPPQQRDVERTRARVTSDERTGATSHLVRWKLPRGRSSARLAPSAVRFPARSSGMGGESTERRAKKRDFNFPDIPVCLRAGSGRTCRAPILCFQTSGERRPLPMMTGHERKSEVNMKVIEQSVSRRQMVASPRLSR